MKPKIRIDVVSDIVCPWCYIGKKRLEKAMDALKSEFDFELEYHPFELNPSLPSSGTPAKEYLVERFGGEDRYDQITGRVTQVAAAEGLAFDFEIQKVSPNTRRAHALVALATEKGVHLEVVEALFKAYFTNGIDLSKDENLVDIGVQYGLERDTIIQFLNNPQAEHEIAARETQMGKLGITGVPFYIVNRKYGVSGAQAVEHFIEVIKEVSIEPASADSCDVNGENC